jgi:ketosteroid isomerase-like protein
MIRGEKIMTSQTLLAGAAVLALSGSSAAAEDDQAVVAAMDIAYQAAVKRNDLATMDRILHPDFVLVRANGAVVTRAELMADAPHVTYEIQDEDPGTQVVRLFGKDTAVVTARLRVKGQGKAGAFDRTVWFSDTYVRTAQGWRYAFAQVAIPPAETR